MALGIKLRRLQASFRVSRWYKVLNLLTNNRDYVSILSQYINTVPNIGVLSLSI